MGLLLRFEVSAFEAAGVVGGLRLQGFEPDVSVRSRDAGRRVIMVDTDPSRADEARDAVQLLAGDAVETE